MAVTGEMRELDSVRRDWALLVALTALFAFGFAVYNGIFQNFARERLAMQPQGLGLLESLREIPGLLTAFTAGTLVALAEPRVAGIALAICGLGIGLTGQMGSYWPLVGITVFWSVGFHLWMSVQPAIVVSLAKADEGGRRLGQMAGVSAATTVAALGFTLLAKQWSPYSLLFLLAGASIVIGSVLGFRLSTHLHTQPRSRLVCRREYGLYYWLNFLEGCRRQIFMTFASFTLIAVYHTPVQTMLILALLNATSLALAAPLVGRWMDRFGERPLMSAYYCVLVLIFTGYATVRIPALLYAFYITDALLSSCAVGVTTYLNRIVRPGDLTPSLAMGLTMNHVAAVVVPVTGGYLWQYSGNYQIPFWIGVGLAVVSVLTALRLPDVQRSPAVAADTIV
jgi:hypothetical protein